MAINFTDLTDVPSAYTGAGGKGVRVKADETGLEFVTEIAPTVQVSAWQADTLLGDQPLIVYLSPEAWTLPADMTGSQIDVGVAPTATAALDVRKNGTSVGSITITTTPTYTFATTGGVAVDFIAGDRLEVVGPTVADATLAQITLTLTGPKV